MRIDPKHTTVPDNNTCAYMHTHTCVWFGAISPTPILSTIEFLTRSTHAYNASRRSKHHARMGHVAQVSGVARLVGVQRAVQNNGNMNSEPKIPGCEESPVATCFLLLNFFWFSSCILGFYGGLTSLFYSLLHWLAVAAFGTRFCTKLRKIRTLRRPSRAVLSLLRCQKNVVPTSCNARGIRYPAWA